MRVEQHGSSVYLWTADDPFATGMTITRARELIRQLTEATAAAEAFRERVSRPRPDPEITHAVGVPA